MKKRNLLIPISLLLIFSSCGGPTSSSNENSSSNVEQSSSTSSLDSSIRDVNYPTEIPLYDETSIQIHYQRKNNTYDPWTLWLWVAGEISVDGAMYDFNYMDDFGVVASYPLSTFSEYFNTDTNDIGFIVRKKDNTWTKDDGSNADRFIDFNSLEPDENNVYHIYLVSGDSNVYTNANKELTDIFYFARFDTESRMVISANQNLDHYEIYKNDELMDTVDLEYPSKYISHVLKDDEKADIKNKYSIKVRFQKSQKLYDYQISIRKLFQTESFAQYHYDGDLGVIYTKEKSTFRVWSPISDKIILKVYESGTPTSVNSELGNDTVLFEIDMEKTVQGVFEANISEDLEGKYYTYTVYNSYNPNGKEIVDPYALSAGVNGLRGMIVDFEKTNPEGWDEVSPIQYDRKELTVYETHVADVTSSSTWNGSEENRKKFLGLVEEGTTYTENDVTVSTGFDHIKELGVNAVQLIPIFDQANDEENPTFNWGYNPLNYNVLEGSYSSDPYDGYARIKEFKKVVQEYNKAGINIIMDVVYNHVNGLKGSNFDTLMPGYYFRYTINEEPGNASGCGNETASENYMFSKFMKDSTEFLAREYKLGGFRFDLMRVHDLNTMNTLVANLKTFNPNIVVYGEPWASGDPLIDSKDQAGQTNTNLFEGYGQFNDQCRDALIKGGMKGAKELGWITSTEKLISAFELKQVIEGIKGCTRTSLTNHDDPNKTVNYVTCHDNYTLYDRFKAAGIEDEAMIKQMAILANSVVLTSQGTSFFLAVEEFLRTKNGNHNSYNSTYEENELNYALKVKHLDMFEMYKKLIAFKQDVDGMHLDVGQNTELKVSIIDEGAAFKYTINDVTNSREYVVVHSSYVGSESRSKVDLSGYTVYLDTCNVLTGELNEVTPLAGQTIIAYKNI